MGESSITAFTGFPALATHPWAYPALEAAHIVGIAVLVGNLVLLEFRVWGAVPELPVRPLARLSLRLALGGFAVAALTGGAMFVSQPADLLANRAFVVKMGLVALAGLNAATFHARDGLSRLDGLAKAQTAFSLGLWVLVIICGRWIAYR